jgi:CBS domain containing-hemolysin-like protein
MVQTDFVLICLSKTSVQKRGYVNKEIKWALDRQDEMLPGDIVYLDDHSALVTAHMDIDAVNKQFMLSLPTTEDYQTLAGFVIHSLQKIPGAGEQLQYGEDLVFTVKTVKGPKLEQIQITRHPVPLRRRVPRRQP